MSAGGFPGRVYVLQNILNMRKEITRYTIVYTDWSTGDTVSLPGLYSVNISTFNTRHIARFNTHNNRYQQTRDFDKYTKSVYSSIRLISRGMAMPPKMCSNAVTKTRNQVRMLGS